MEETKDEYKKWCIFTIITIVLCLMVSAALIIIVDPYWHFHGPIESISYRLGNGRYMNDGILKKYDYDSVIIGTSMSENFKPSQWKKLTGENTVKTPFYGATFKEIHDTLERAFSEKKDIQTVIWGLDYNQLTSDWDKNKYDKYPNYLYDNTILNDGNYLWNKTVLLRGILPDFIYTVLEKPSSDFDAYASWKEPSGKDAVMSGFVPGKGVVRQNEITYEVERRVEENVSKNIEDVVRKNPETQFYFFLTPYSIAYWDSIYHSGRINEQVDATRIFAEHLLQYDNVKFFCFFDNVNMICDLNNYVDAGHYTEKINEKILQWMIDGNYEWTLDNYLDKLNEIREVYSEFDYAEYWS